MLKGKQFNSSPPLSPPYCCPSPLRSYSIVSSRDVVLGEMEVVFQLHLNVQGNKGACVHKHMGSPAAEFVIGPGATNKPGQPATLRADLSKLRVINPWQKWCDVGQVVGGVVEEGGAAVGSVGKGREGGAAVGSVEKGREGGAAVDKGDIHIGTHQMELISELLERGSKLRDKMIGSLTGTK